jgi:high-affinity nickel-transport protein
MTFGLIASAFLLGLRHGIDWDHLAAISDIAATQDTPRRGVALSTLYVVGHASVVFVIGVVVIVTGRNLPSWADSVMTVVVGWTLVILGSYVAYTLIRYRGAVPLRSRWMIVLSTMRRGYLWLRTLLVSVPTTPVAHEHAHSGVVGFHHGDEPGEDVPASGRLPRHRHRHTHDDPFVDYTAKSALGVGMLHGVGAETPTQVLVFLAAASAGGTVAGLAVLSAFVIGLGLANSAITVGAAFGFFASRKRLWLHASLAGATAVGSLAVGALLIAGQDGVLPAFFAG